MCRVFFDRWGSAITQLVSNLVHLGFTPFYRFKGAGLDTLPSVKIMTEKIATKLQKRAQFDRQKNHNSRIADTIDACLACIARQK
jgi:hypothetical protein